MSHVPHALSIALRRMSTLCVAACLMSAHDAGAASSILIAPVDPKLFAENRSVAIWLENRGKQNVALQIRVLGWVQQQGLDGYREQADVVASPPAATVVPGQKQMIRIIKATEPAPGAEQAYRVIVDEIPMPGAQDTRDGVGIRFQMRYSVPLFVYGRGLWIRDPVLKDGKGKPGQPVLNYMIESEGGQQRIGIRNIGPVHARISAASFVDASGREHELAAGLLGYVLPGASMHWPLPAGVNPAGMTFKAKINDEPERWVLRAPP